jgi:phytol kinase
MLNEFIIAAVSFFYILVCRAAGGFIVKMGLSNRYYAFYLVRIGVTGWILLAYVWLKNPFIVAAIPAFFFIANVLIRLRVKRLSVFLSPDAETGKTDPCLILSPFAAAFLVFTFWLWVPDYKFVAVIALLAAGWGVSAAAIIDRSLGRYKYHIFGKTKSVEGSATMFLVTFIAASALMPTSKIGSGTFLSTSICAAVAATAADNMSPRLTEALAVPFATAAVVLWWALAV